MQIATISSKFQISVPKKMREQLHIKVGQQFIFIPKGNCLELVPKKNMNELKGILSGVDTNHIRDRSDRT